MPEPYERYLADLASADGMPEAPADPGALQPPTREEASDPATM
ncbi:MAG TPA: hypothetical protein VFR81_17550 [Longimicrobium sp.]|nr:hypothetical protein [Longimicrobium sp.]